METLECFYQNQRIIEECTSQWLAGIPSVLGRKPMLRDVTLGCYRHPALKEVYSEVAVHQALLYCREELFENFLEASLEQQEQDLRLWLAGTDMPMGEVASRWLEVEFYRLLAPLGAPRYLRDLPFSNLGAILSMIIAEHTPARTAA